MARELDDPLGLTYALSLLGFVAEDREEFTHALALHEEARATATIVDDPAWLAWTLRNVGWLTYRCGAVSRGERQLEEALALFRRAGHHHGLLREQLVGWPGALRQRGWAVLGTIRQARTSARHRSPRWCTRVSGRLIGVTESPTRTRTSAPSSTAAR